MTDCPIRYRVQAADCKGHYFDVQLQINNPDPEGQTLRLPAWLPGSYMIRDFAKNIIELQVMCEEQSIAVTRIDKQTWQLTPCNGPIIISYKVYAKDLSVRTAYLDDQFGFYNHSALCLEVVGQADVACEIHLVLPVEKQHWIVATGMPATEHSTTSDYRFYAENYEQLIDYPVLMGELEMESFNVKGTRHRIALCGRHYADLPRITADLSKVCEAQIGLFNNEAPFEEYTFLVMVVGNGFGGLEHRNSTALLCSRKDLIHRNQNGITDSYRTFLSLCSHEYFHSWNIKRLRPREFIPFHLDKEQYTEQLWFYEGVTSYYDDLFVHRAGLSSTQQYLDTLAATLSRGLMGQGPRRQTITESSQLAWTTFYQQNENASNAIASYYSKGALTALGLDLILRRHSQGQCSLDDVMRQLWLAYGQDERGTTQEALIDTLIEFAGAAGKDEMKTFIHQALFTTDPLPIADLLCEVGIEVQQGPAETDNGPFGKAPRINMPVSLGARFNANEQGLELLSVAEGGAAYQAGLSAGDKIIAMDYLQISAANQLEFFSRYAPGDEVTVHAFRRNELSSRQLCWQAPAADNWSLKVVDSKKTQQWFSITLG